MTNRNETMRTRFAVRCVETGIDHIIFDVRGMASVEANEMTRYHGIEFTVVEVKTRRTYA